MPSYPFFCGKDCGGNACPLTATVENGRVTRITNNPSGGKYLKGCWRGLHQMDAQYAPDRILTPLIRTGPRGSGQFREASWEEALSRTAARLSEIRERYGPQSIMEHGSAGDTGALHGTRPLLNRFLNLFGGCTRLASNYSNGAASFVLPYLFGKEASVSGFDAATMQYSEIIVLWGANVLDTRMGAEIPLRLLEARGRGAQIVVIDPRCSNTVRQAATWWIPCRPGTDAALMLSVLYVLITEDLIDRPFIEAHSVGFGQLEAYLLGRTGEPARTPAWAEAICGVPAAEITRFARAYAAAKPAMLLPGFSIQRVFAGEETFRLAAALQVATGNLGRRGGSSGSINNNLPGLAVGSLPVPPFPDQPVVPVVRWPDAVLEGRQSGYPTDIHAIYALGSNFVNQGSHIARNIAAFQKVDFAVCHEVFLTPTARYCDVIFPAATAFEKEDIGIPWLGSYLLYRPQILQPPGQARSDYDILCDLAARLGFLPEFSENRTAAEWIQHFLDHSEVPDQAEFRQTGIYLVSGLERTGLAEFAADPINHPLSTPSGKVELASEAYQHDTGHPAFPTWQLMPADPRYPLRLITPKSAYRVHSQGSNLHHAQALARHALEMHPQDAAKRGIAEGDRICLYNAQGMTHVLAHLTETITPGVVCLPEGVWFDPDQAGIDQAGSANVLTSTEGTVAARNNIMHGVLVEVQTAASQGIGAG